MVRKLWSKAWNSSVQPRKQRKYLYNAPLHVKHKLLSASLSSDLKKEYGIRSFTLRKGDSVKVVRGQFKGTVGKITKVSLKQTFVHVDGASVTKSDGSQSLYPIHPSNVIIQKLELTDKQRAEKLERMKA